MDLKELHLAPSIEDIGKNWYYAVKSEAINSYLDQDKVKNIIDVGAGSGYFAYQFAKNNIADHVYCVDINYDNERQEVLENGNKIDFVKSLKNDDIIADVALFNDVIEHVPDDIALLKEYIPQIKKGGYVLVTVPAFHFMWSTHDDYLGHYRRYTIKSLNETMQKAGLEVIKCNYFFASLFPLVFVMRKLGDIKRKILKTPMKSDMANQNPLISKILRNIHFWESKIIFPHNKLYGLTVFCLARKK